MAVGLVKVKIMFMYLPVMLKKPKHELENILKLQR